MKTFIWAYLLATLSININGYLFSKKIGAPKTDDHRVFANVKIYSNLAEVVKPLGNLPVEFSAEDWSDIRSDSVTLVGENVNVTQQTVTEKKKSLNNAQVYVRSPSSTNSATKFLKATMIDENRNLVKLQDKDISGNPIYFNAQSDHIVYENEPPQSKYYVNFTYDTTDAVYLSYLRSNLNWKTRYQLDVFEESKKPTLIAMADIRNDGQSKVDIEHAELLAGDINLHTHSPKHRSHYRVIAQADAYGGTNKMYGVPGAPQPPPAPGVGQGEELAGLYVFTIDQPFSIEGKTNHILPMFRPTVTIERYALILKYFYGGVGSSTGKAQRAYRLQSDRFLSRGNCIIRENDRLVGEVELPDIAAKNKHEFTVGQDSDIIYKQNVTLVSTRTTNTTSTLLGRPQPQTQTQTTFNVTVMLKSFKKDRPVKLEYEERMHGNSMKLTTTNSDVTQDNMSVKYKTTLPPNGEKSFSFKVEIIS